MRDRSDPQRVSKRRPQERGKIARNKSLTRSRKGKNVSKPAERKPIFRPLLKKLPLVVSDMASQYHMTLRSRIRDDSMHNRDSAVCLGEMMPQHSQATTSTLPAFSATEPVVRASSHMPTGYTFVPKGNPYLTRNCRRQTQLSHQTVYAVVNDQKKQVGIRVPWLIYAVVRQNENDTLPVRQKNVRKRDESLENRFREAIKKQFPRISHEVLSAVVRHATAKRKGRVGRTKMIDIEQKARLAVQAYVRHIKTNYEDLLRSGIDREEARNSTSQRTFDILRDWGPTPTRKHIPMKPSMKIGDQLASRKRGAPLETATEAARQGARAKRVKTAVAAANSNTSQKREQTTTENPHKPAKRINLTPLPTPTPFDSATRRAGLNRFRRHRTRSERLLAREANHSRL
ncbi:hypothetical protein GGR58DRAFT_451376 [Xylaria digitata]|nr:hypothetical protein GGR58DRAFT_451376 [Xylaria digitata]